MPIYEYQCQVCGYRTEILQKMNEKPLTKCSECGQKMRRLVSAPAFQLKGEGWYVTDFRDKDKKPKKPETAEGTESASTTDPNAKAENSSDKSPKEVVAPPAAKVERKADKKVEKEK